MGGGGVPWGSIYRYKVLGPSFECPRVDAENYMGLVMHLCNTHMLMQYWCSFTGKCGQWCSDAIFMPLPQKATVGSWLEMRLHHWDNEGHVDVVDVNVSIGDDRVQNLTTPITIMMMIRRMTSWGIFSQVPQLPWMSSRSKWVGEPD